jgi:hypothetical protein
MQSRIPDHISAQIDAKDQAIVASMAARYVEVLDRAAAVPRNQRTKELNGYIAHYRELTVMNAKAPILADQWEMVRNDVNHFAEIFAAFL